MIYRDQVPEHLKTAGQLLAVGKRPSDPAAPSAWLETEFRGDLWRTGLFPIDTALPIPPATVVPSATDHPEPSARQAAARWARAVLRDPNAVVVDTELTDFHGRLVEVAVVATDGTVLLESLVNPEGTPINPHAGKVHGITEAMLVDAPTTAQLWDRLDAVLRGKTIIAWNAPFDEAKLDAERERLADAGHAPPADWLRSRWKCAMREHATWVGVRGSTGSGYRNHKLHGGHRARGDCVAVLHRLREMAASLPEPSAAPPSSVRDHDPAAVHRHWPEVVAVTRSHSPVTAAMLNAVVVEVDGRDLVLSHPSAAVARRLADDGNSSTVRNAVRAVLGGTWTMRWGTSTPPPSGPPPAG